MFPSPSSFLDSPTVLGCFSMLLTLGGSVWGVAIGLLVGMLLPRPRGLTSRIGNVFSMVFSASASSTLRYFTLLVNFAVLVREVWCQNTKPGTFRAFLSSLRHGGRPGPKGAKGGAAGPSPASPLDDPDAYKDAGRSIPALGAQVAPVFPEGSWYVTERDLGFFRYRVEFDGEVPGAGKWDLMMDKTLPGMTYAAQRRMLPEGKTEYKSVTMFEDATAEEVMDFYLDDPERERWDSLLTATQTLEDADFADRRQVVLWVRNFPFSFIKQREYVIARRVFRGADGTLYGITKGVHHPRRVPTDGIVRCDMFYSMWSCKTVPCPRGTDRPATRCVLLHLEDFKIPERLARFAVSQGMWNFIKKMAPHFRGFVAGRRTRTGPSEADPKAFGHGRHRNPPTAEEMAVMGLGPLAGLKRDLGAEGRPLSAEPSGGASPRKGGFKKVGSFLVAGCAAVALAPPGLVGGAAAGATCAAALVGTAIVRGGSRRRISQAASDRGTPSGANTPRESSGTDLAPLPGPVPLNIPHRLANAAGMHHAPSMPSLSGGGASSTFSRSSSRRGSQGF